MRDIVISVDRGCVLHDGREVRLRAKTFQVLVYLHEHHGRLVTKEDLLRAAWPDTFVSDDSLTKCIREIREALGDRDHQLLKTVARRGFILDAPLVAAGPTGEGRQAPAPREPSVPPTHNLPAHEALAPAPVVQRRQRKAGALAVASIAALAIVVYGVWRARQFVPLRPSEQRLLSTREGSHRAPAFAPDGRRLAFLAPDNDKVPQIWVRDVAQDAAVQVTSGPIGAGRPRWSPAGDRIVFARGNEGIWSVSPLGGSPTRITDRGTNPSFSRDGQKLVFESERRLWTAAADGSDVREVAGTPDVYYTVPMGPALSPDGSQIVFFRPEAGPNGDLWVVPADGGPAHQLTFDLREGGWPCWTPDGKTIVFSSARGGSRTLWQIPVIGGEPVPLTSGAGEDDQPDISPDGRHLAYTSVRNSWELRVRNLEAGTERSLLRKGVEILFPMFAPDGQRIVFFGRSDSAVAIFTIASDGSDLRQLTGGRELNHQPRWDGDGQNIYFFQMKPSTSFRRVPAPGGPSVRFRDWKWETHYGPMFDPGGQMIAYVRQRAPGESGGEPPRTVIHDIATGSEQFWPAPATRVTGWSRDSSQLVGHRADGTIVLCAVADAACRVLTKGTQPVWPAGSDRVLFRRRPGPEGPEQLWSIQIDGRGEQLVAELGDFRPIDRFFDASRDGRVVWAPFFAGQHQLWAAVLR